MEAESSLSSYRIFNTVAATGNLSKAAKELTISQPAISKAVSRLEQSLCVKLFERNSRGVKLTEEGELLYEYTCSAFESLRLGEESIRRFHALGVGRIRLGVSDSLCNHLLLPYLQGFIREFPQIHIGVECLSAAEALSFLEDGRLDIALTERPARTKEFDFTPLCTLTDCFVASPEYLNNLKKRDPNVSLSSAALLSCSNLMLPDSDTLSYRDVQDYLASHHLLTSPVPSVAGMDRLIDFARVGLGVACVIREFVEEDLQNGTLVEVLSLGRNASHSVGFICKKGAQSSERIRRFLDFCKGGNA